MKIGNKVIATCIITEGGDTFTPDPEAKTFINNPGYVHANIGDIGEILYIDNDGDPTVRFQPSGTSTVVAASEIQLQD